MEIRQDDLSSDAIKALLSTHHTEAHEQVSQVASHAFSIERLKHPDVTFWSAWDEGVLLGCCALLEIAPDHGEIKSMHTASAHRRKGVSTALLRHIVDVAWRRGYKRVSLETHPTPGYAPARAMYRGFGFTECEVFGGHDSSPSSVFMTLLL